MAWVVDASVAAKWLFAEPYSEQAAALLTGGEDLLTVDLLFAEIGNVAWKKLGRENLSYQDVAQALADLREIALTVYPVAELMEQALKIAQDHRRSFYDASYLALAVREDTPLITADLRFHNAFAATSLHQSVHWIGNLQETRL
ncbi:MAG: type II toxin-antitoxin system VapC family toxin [Pseudomonadota bacterium]